MSIFYPDYRFDSLMEIAIEDLKNMGVKGIVLDLDNTTAHDHTDKPLDGAKEWIEKVKNAGFKIMILSNGRKDRAESFAKLLSDIDFVGFALKPLYLAYLKAQYKLKLRPKELVMIGDQIFTDVLGANFAGWKSVYVKPFAKEKRDVKSFAIRRHLENKIFEKMDGKQENKN